MILVDQVEAMVEATEVETVMEAVEVAEEAVEPAEATEADLVAVIVIVEAVLAVDTEVEVIKIKKITATQLAMITGVLISKHSKMAGRVEPAQQEVLAILEVLIKKISVEEALVLEEVFVEYFQRVELALILPLNHTQTKMIPQALEEIEEWDSEEVEQASKHLLQINQTLLVKK